VKDAIAGTNAGFLNQLPQDIQVQALDIIVRSMDRVYILGITAGAVSLLCGVFLSQRKLDMRGAAAGM
jgi:hypothetical protein